MLSCSLAIPTEIAAAPDGARAAGGRSVAGDPQLSASPRGGKTINAAAKSEVDWQDQIDTHANARARVLLDDGSVLNVGADSSMRVIKHDAGRGKPNWS